MVKAAMIIAAACRGECPARAATIAPPVAVLAVWDALTLLGALPDIQDLGKLGLRGVHLKRAMVAPARA
jgi:hypothetical protein